MKVGKLIIPENEKRLHVNYTDYVVYSYDRDNFVFRFAFENYPEINGEAYLILKADDMPTQQFTLTIENKRAEWIVPERLLGYEGHVKGYLYLTENDLIKSEDAYMYTFLMRRSQIDEGVLEIESMYFEKFEDLVAKMNLRFDELSASASNVFNNYKSFANKKKEDIANVDLDISSDVDEIYNSLLEFYLKSKNLMTEEVKRVADKKVLVYIEMENLLKSTEKSVETMLYDIQNKLTDIDLAKDSAMTEIERYINQIKEMIKQAEDVLGGIISDKIYTKNEVDTILLDKASVRQIEALEESQDRKLDNYKTEVVNSLRSKVDKNSFDILDAEVIDARNDTKGIVHVDLGSRLDTNENLVSGIEVEIDEARGEAYATLGERLEEDKAEIEAEFEHMKKQTIYLEDNPLVAPETTSGWISRVVNSAKYGRVIAQSGKTYYIGSPIVITQSDVYLDFNNAVLASQGSIGYQIYINNANNVTIENIFIAKTESDSGNFLQAENVTDLTVRGVHGANVGFYYLFNLKGVARSRFKDITVKNSNATKKGYGFRLEYCVNVSFDSIFLEYFINAMHLTNIKSNGTNGYMNEGISLTNFFSIKQNIGLQVDQCTEFQISNIIFDFCASYGVLINNCLSLKMDNYWLGLQDGAASGIEVVDGVSITATNGTIAGDWSKRATQKAFYSAVDTLMTVNNVYLIDVNGGNLDRSKISVSGDTYFQTGQSKIARYETGVVTLVFDGSISPLVFNKAKTYFSAYSYDKNNVANFVRSEGYVNDSGITHISKIAFGGTGVAITHVVDSGGFKLQLDSTYDMSDYKTMIVRHIPQDVYFRPE